MLHKFKFLLLSWIHWDWKSRVYFRTIFHKRSFLWSIINGLIKIETSPLSNFWWIFTYKCLLFIILLVSFLWLSDLALKKIVLSTTGPNHKNRASILYVFSKTSCKHFGVPFSFHEAIHYCIFVFALKYWNIEFKWCRKVQNYYLGRCYFLR